MKRMLVLSVVIFSIAGSPIQSVCAKESKMIMQADGKDTRIQRADVIVEKYRMFNGVLQYRRWNETRNCWVDPDWIDIA